VRSAEGIEGKSKSFSKLFLQDMHFRAILRDRESGFVGGEFGRRAVLVRGANEQDFMAAGSMEARAGVGGKHRANEVTQMLYPVDVRQR
jgi:hypothetical protein